MNPEQYSAEQKQDIESRVEEARKLLEGLYLRPSSQVSTVNIGDDIFAHKVQPYLQDTKYTAQISPIQENNL